SPGNFLLATILCLALGNALAADVMEGSYNVTQVCTMVKTGTQLGSIQSCDYYYVCTSSGPVMSFCSSGYSYNYKTQNCVPEGQVDCYYGLENPCAGKTGANWVPNVSDCHSYFYCNNAAVAGHGTCGAGQRFESASQRCIYGSCGSADADTTGPSLVNFCSVVPPNMYFGATDNCQTWYYCNSAGTQTTDTCKTSAFIVSTGSCGYNNQPGACDRVVTAPVPTSCTVKNEKAPDNTTCGNWYLCDGSTYQLQVCPTGTYFDVNTETCRLRQQATPAFGCNRCQYASVSFVNAVDDEQCSNYYYCSNGKNGNDSECPTGRFFNEDDQACAVISGLAGYVPTHGACKGATATTSTGTTGTVTDAP
ncbi:hypothetical protein KR044_007744, partial [Drosophila immigrans]